MTFPPAETAFVSAIAVCALLALAAFLLTSLRVRSIERAIENVSTTERDAIQDVADAVSGPLRRCLIRAGCEAPAKVELEWRAFRPGIFLLTPRVLVLPSSSADPLDFDCFLLLRQERLGLQRCLARAMRARLGAFWRLRKAAHRNYAVVTLPTASRHDVIAAMRPIETSRRSALRPSRWFRSPAA